MKNAILFLLLVFGVSTLQAQHNTLSKAEKKEGWKLLFDGKSVNGWRKFKGDKPGAAWKVSNGELFFDPSVKEGRGDLMTHEEFENFEIVLEWKIAACGNSGLIFNVVEAEKYKDVWVTGPEMQIIDNSCHPDAKIEKHKAGDLYDLIACSTITVNPAGEWNKVRMVSNKGHLEFYINDVKVVETTMNSPEWNELVQKSKFKNMPDFGKSPKGHISLQDHGDQVWFRNIKIKILK